MKDNRLGSDNFKHFSMFIRGYYKNMGQLNKDENEPSY